MELAHAHRDQLTRDFHNKIDTHRQKDSGLRGMLPDSLKTDPTATAHKWRQEFDALPLPPGIKQVGGAGLAGFELGTKLGTWIREKT